jgi:hypothetical protein
MPPFACLLLLITGVAAAANPAAGAADPLPLQPAELTLDLDASGQPSGLACTAEVPAATCRALVGAASHWQYSPGQASGKPVAMKAAMTVDLQAVPKGGGYALHATRASVREVANSMTSAEAGRKLTPPVYPRDEMIRHQEAHVVLELWFQPGTDRTKVRNAWVDGKQPRWKNAFIAAATAAAERWPLRRGSENVLSLCIPVDFTLGKPPARQATEPCQPTYVAGYKPPALVTTVEQMHF